MPTHTKTAVVIRHVPFEDLGTFEGVLAGRGYTVAYREAGVDDLAAIDPTEPDLLIVLGGPIGAYEEAEYPFVMDEVRLLERRLAVDRPTLGICLGAQMMARALGARVYPGGRQEIGAGTPWPCSFTSRSRPAASSVGSSAMPARSRARRAWRWPSSGATPNGGVRYLKSTAPRPSKPG